MILKIGRFLVDTESGVVLEKTISTHGAIRQSSLAVHRVKESAWYAIEETDWEKMLTEYGFVEDSPSEDKAGGEIRGQWGS